MDGSLTTTATVPETSAPYRIESQARDHGGHVVMASGQPLFVADARNSPHCDRRIIELLGAAVGPLHADRRPHRRARSARGVLAGAARRGHRGATSCSSACWPARRRSRCSAPTSSDAWTS